MSPGLGTTLHEVRTTGWSLQPGWKLVHLHGEHRSMFFDDQDSPVMLSSNVMASPLLHHKKNILKRRNSFSEMWNSTSEVFDRWSSSLVRHKKPPQILEHTRHRNWNQNAPPSDESSSSSDGSSGQSDRARGGSLRRLSGRRPLPFEPLSELPSEDNRAVQSRTGHFQSESIRNHPSSRARARLSKLDWFRSSLQDLSHSPQGPQRPPRCPRINLMDHASENAGLHSVLKKPGSVRGPKQLKKVAFLENTQSSNSGRSLP